MLAQYPERMTFAKRPGVRQSPGAFSSLPDAQSFSLREKAGRIIAEELRRRGWTEADLQPRRKGDKHKVKLAARLRAETTMSLKWIAEHLSMGSWTYVSNLLAKTKTPKV